MICYHKAVFKYRESIKLHYFRYFIYPGLKKYNTKREIGECYRDTMYYFDKKYDVASCELKYVEK